MTFLFFNVSQILTSFSLCIGRRQEAEEGHDLHQETIALEEAVVPEEAVALEEVVGLLPAAPADDLPVVPPALHSSTMLLVDEAEAQHLAKRRKLELTLLQQQIETEKSRTEAERRRIEAENVRVAAFSEMRRYYANLADKHEL